LKNIKPSIFDQNKPSIDVVKEWQNMKFTNPEWRETYFLYKNAIKFPVESSKDQNKDD